MPNFFCQPYSSTNREQILEAGIERVGDTVEIIISLVSISTQKLREM